MRKNFLILYIVFSVLFCAKITWADTPELCEVGVVGTVHQKHFTDSNYPVRVLESLIDVYKPEQIFIEISSQELSQEDWSHTPPEMLHIAQYARESGIAVAGFDELHREHILSESVQLHIKNLRQTLSETVNPLSFEKIHSADTDEALKRYFAGRDSILKSSHSMRAREKFMDQEVVRLLTSSKVRKTLIFTGFTHRLHLETAVSGVCRRISYKK